MKTRIFYLLCACLMLPMSAFATKFLELKVVDKEYLMLIFRDGEVFFRDDATGPSAHRGHDFAEGDDTLKVYGKELNCEIAAQLTSWRITSSDDKAYGAGLQPIAVHRKSKVWHHNEQFQYKHDHTIFLKLPAPMKQGCTYLITMDKAIETDVQEASLKFDINQCQSEAIHVNIIGYSPKSSMHAADLYLWMGDGGQRNYSSYEGKRVYLYNVNTGKRRQVGKVAFWKSHQTDAEPHGRNMTGSDVWNIDFKGTTPGRYRLVVEDVGCSMDFDISKEVYFEPYKFSVRGYYYMRLGEDRLDMVPVPRRPTFIPEVEPKGFTIYLTDLQPWHPEWRKYRGDIWDEPHFKPALQSMFWKHRLPGNPTNPNVRGGHSDAFDWDRHLAHVSNIYDLLLPYFLSNGALNEDNLQIGESGNGIPDLIDEARNEVDMWLALRDGEAYCHGLTNPSQEHTIMFQAGATTMAAWANAANCAMIAECFRISGHTNEMNYYRDEAIKAYRFAQKQANQQLDDVQDIGDRRMRGRDFKQMAAAFLYNVTGDKVWEEDMASESLVKNANSKIDTERNGYQLWGTAAYLNCPQTRNYPELYDNMKRAVIAQALDHNVKHMDIRPSRRTSNDNYWQTTQNLHLVILSHFITTDKAQKKRFEKALYVEADWGLGRNPSNTVEMTGLGQRHMVNIYTTGRNDGTPGLHPGQTPYNNLDTWNPSNGSDPKWFTSRCYPDWEEGGWPHQEGFFNSRYVWANGEFTPRQTMRGKMALLGYLYFLR